MVFMTEKGDVLTVTLQQMKNILTIAREGSITRASRVLFRAQSNLSSMVREVEEELHITIFDRTPSGVKLTLQGEQFVACAGDIVAKMEKLEQIGKKTEEVYSMGLSVCRASYCVRAASEWINHTFDSNQKLSLRLHETNADEAIEQVLCGESALGMIRLPVFYENYYLQKLEQKGLCSERLMEFTMMLIMRGDHPMASLPVIRQEDLYRYTEIVHGDQQSLALSMARINPLLRGTPLRRIYVYDRGSQIDLLQRLPGAYMWVSPIPLDMVDSYGMCIRSCSLSTVVNLDLLIWRREMMEQPGIQNCGEFLRRYAARLQDATIRRLEHQCIWKNSAVRKIHGTEQG